MLTINGSIKTSGPNTTAKGGDATYALIRLRITDASIDDSDPLATHTKHGLVYKLRPYALKWTASANQYQSEHAEAKLLHALVPDGFALDDDGFVALTVSELVGLYATNDGGSRGGPRVTAEETSRINTWLSDNGLQTLLAGIDKVTAKLNEGRPKALTEAAVEKAVKDAERVRREAAADDLGL
jgi:hypothetical protein